MTHAMKLNNDTKENRYEAMKAAFRDMHEYYHRQDKPLITASVRQLNEYFRNLECSQRIIQYFCKTNSSHLPDTNSGVGRPLRDFKTHLLRRNTGQNKHQGLLAFATNQHHLLLRIKGTRLYRIIPKLISSTNQVE